MIKPLSKFYFKNVQVFYKLILCFLYRVAKDQKKATKAAKKVTTAPSKPKQAKVKATKVTQKAAPRVGGKR